MLATREKSKRRIISSRTASLRLGEISKMLPPPETIGSTGRLFWLMTVRLRILNRWQSPFRRMFIQSGDADALIDINKEGSKNNASISRRRKVVNPEPSPQGKLKSIRKEKEISLPNPPAPKSSDARGVIRKAVLPFENC